MVIDTEILVSLRYETPSSSCIGGHLSLFCVATTKYLMLRDVEQKKIHLACVSGSRITAWQREKEPCAKEVRHMRNLTL